MAILPATSGRASAMASQIEASSSTTSTLGRGTAMGESMRYKYLRPMGVYCSEQNCSASDSGFCFGTGIHSGIGDS